MLTVQQMPSQDGYGYGKSMLLEYKAIKIANKHQENCSHFETASNVWVQFIPWEKPRDNLVNCEVKCKKCDKVMTKTSEILTRKFLRLYGKDYHEK
jgi:hypothetical protein